MGRRKITIKQISDPKLRHITFNKRKNGLIKKAAELSVLCNVPMLLVFEDSNGNLIQFTRNNINSIPEFFQTLRYNNVVEFNASQYPTFFKVNHYKKHKDREMDDQYSQDEDMDYGEEDDMKSPVYVEESPEYRPTKKIRTQNVKEEDRNMIYQSTSEQEDNGEMPPMNEYNEEETKLVPQVQEKARTFQRVRATSKPEEKIQQQKVFISEEQEMEMAQMDEPEIPMPRKESFQSFREVSRVRIEKNIEYQQPQFNGFENSFKRTSQNNDQNNSFRYYPSDNNNNMNNGNMQKNNNNNFNNVPKLPNKNQFLNNNVNNNNTNMVNNMNNNMNQNFGQNQMQRSSNNHHGYKRATHFNSHKAQILRGFANMGMNNMQNMGGMVNMNMGNMQNLNGMNNLNNMNGMNNMGNISNEETLNAMLKGLPSLGFMGQANSFIAKGGNKAEMDEKLLDTANMIKYLNSTNAASYPASKMYNFQNADNNKNDETDNMYNLRNRNEGENGNYDNESEFNDQQQYMRGEFRLENNLPSNLPSAYFSSKKFNFDGYFSNFEEDKFNEFGDPKKKQSKIN